MGFLDRTIAEYHRVDRMIKQLEARKTILNKSIKWIMMEEKLENYENEAHRATLQVKRHRISYDEGAMQQLLMDKGLWERSQRVVPDEQIVRQMWIDGDLTDDDLRSILAVPKDPNVALKVEPCTKE